jgi:transposase
MEASIQGDGQSTLRINAKGIAIWLPWQVFSDAWQWIAPYLREAIGSRTFIVFTQREMTARAKEPDAPRWKANGVDVLSWVLYLLKVPPDHELVRLWQVIDWAGINRIAGTQYHNAHGGRPAWAPAQVMAILMLMFLYGVAHETTTLARIKENIVWCWFCGFSLFGPFPKHDALYDFRVRMGVERFERILTQVVLACIEVGLVKNVLVGFDLTSVTASAHRWSPYERAVILTHALIRYLEMVWAEQEPAQSFPDALRMLAAEVALEILPHKGLRDAKPGRVVESVEQWAEKAADTGPAWKESSEAIAEEMWSEALLPPWAQQEEQQGHPLRTWLIEMGKRVLGKMAHTRGDPDARVGRTTNYTWFCGYLLGFVVDAFCQVITAVVWASGNSKQYKLFVPAMDAHIERVGKPQAVAADSAFDDPNVHTYLDKNGIVGHITSRDHAKPRDGGYGTDQVIWQEGSEAPLCPNHKPLIPSGKPQRGRQMYEGTMCAQCPIYTRCYPTGEGKVKQFSLHPEQHRRWQENREHCQTDEYKAAHRERFASEGRLGLAKMNHHAARTPYRSDEMNHIAGLMSAIVMDYRILARHQQTRRTA